MVRDGYTSTGVAKYIDGARVAIYKATSFGTLSYGIYQVVQTGATGMAKDYDDFDPIFISVPSLEEERIVHNVVVEPKTSTQPVEKSPEEKPPLAKMGDFTNPQLWTTCLGSGSVLLVGGLTLRRGRKKH